MKCRVLSFAGDPKFYIEVEGTPMLPSMDRVVIGGNEIQYLRRGYPEREEAEAVIAEMLKVGPVQYGEWRLRHAEEA